MARIPLLDGGMGQELVARSGDEPTPLWATLVMIDHPDLVRAIHDDYFAAGATVATTNTYAIHHDRLERFGLDDSFEDLHRAALGAARAARDAHGTGRIAGSIGPLVATYHDDVVLSVEEAAPNIAEIARLLAPQVEVILLGTLSTVAQAKGALKGAVEAGKPVWLSVSVHDRQGDRLRSGKPLADLRPLFGVYGPEAVLANCSVPEAMGDALAVLGTFEPPFGAYANRFTHMSDEFLQDAPTVKELTHRHDLTPARYADFAMGWVGQGATIVGGCCEVGPAHIAELARQLHSAGHQIVRSLGGTRQTGGCDQGPSWLLRRAISWREPFATPRICTPDKVDGPLYRTAPLSPEFVALVALSSPATTPLRSARWAVGVFFFVFGVFIATWVPHIPLAKERLDVSPAWFGAALLCMGGGGVVGMIPVGVLINHLGSARVLTWSASLAAACLPLLALAPNYWAFVAALSTFGALAGMTDVAMNAHGMEVEKRMGRAVLSGFHGLFSVAGLLSAGVASLLIERLSEPERMALSTLFCAAAAFVAGRFLLPAEVDRGTTNKPLAIPNRATVGLGLLALLALLIEGAVLDWAGIHLRATYAADASFTSLLVSAFFGCMAVSRLSGDALRMRLGAARVLRHSAWLTALCLVLALLSPSAPLSLAFFALCGLTVGLMAPVLFAAGGQADPEHAGRGMAAVVSLGYVGLIAGPAFVGFVAQATTLTTGLAAVAGLSLVIWVFGGAARIADGRE